MAFDFERYLQKYKTNESETDWNQSTVKSFDRKGFKNRNETGSSSVTVLSSDFVERYFPHKLGRSGISFSDQTCAKTNVTENQMSMLIESRFRYKLSHVMTKGKSGLSKQLSLPASFSSHTSFVQERTGSGRRRRNSVKFADEVGENLMTFVIIPSRFENIEHDQESEQAILKKSISDTEKGNGVRSSQSLADEKAACFHGCSITGHQRDAYLPPFQLCFDQPAANFAEFSRRVLQQNICLENVKIDVTSQRNGPDNSFISHGIVLCSIRVRNIHPVKRVFARCTDSDWNTYADISAVYVGYQKDCCKEYDTFSFALKNPLGFQGMKSSMTPMVPDEPTCNQRTAPVEFALCYEVLGQAYWDNNYGQNYRIVWI